MASFIDFKNMATDDILEVLNSAGNRTDDGITQIAACFLQHRLHKELLDEQQKFQKKQLRLTLWLVIANWFLVIVTLLLVNGFLPLFFGFIKRHVIHGIA